MWMTLCSEIVQPSKPDKMISVKGRGIMLFGHQDWGGGLGPTDKSLCYVSPDQISKFV